MRAQRIALVVALALAVPMAGAGTAATTGQAPNLSTMEAIDAYLVSIGIDPATVVRQSGPLNYAGPTCPGADWNCTTATKVVQLSQVGGQNAFVCEPEGAGTDPPGVCVIVQTEGGTNRAECRLESDTVPMASQTCTITQTGDRNFATVRMLIDQSVGPIQDAQQTANVIQTATEKNELNVYQTIEQSSTDVTGTGGQMQDAHQVAEVVQKTNGSGTVGNYSHVHQVQDQDLRGAADLQQQNTEPVPTALGDCTNAKPTNVNPNQCADVDQMGDSGLNNSQLHQTITERATSTAESAVTQGLSDGGIEGRVHQVIDGLDGQNVNHAHETVAQRAFVPEGSPLPSQQTDPGCCGVGSQFGGAKANNVEQINLATTQSSQPEGFQVAVLQGTSNTPDGGCSIKLHGRNNSDAGAFTFSDQDGCAVIVTMTCTSFPEEEEEEDVPGCTDPVPVPIIPEDPGPTLLGGQLLTPFATTPTFGLPIEMPDFGEPGDFLAP
jgi:hypothetical protein